MSELSRDHARYPHAGAALKTLLVVALSACGGEAAQAGPTDPVTSATTSDAPRPASCPEQAPAPNPLPGVRPEHQRLDYWLRQAERDGSPDDELLSSAEILAHREALTQGDEPELDARFGLPTTGEQLVGRLRERMEFLRDRFESGRYVEMDGAPIDPVITQIPTSAPVLQSRGELRPELRVATALIALRCAPRLRPFYTRSRDPAFDRNRCSAIRPQEPLEVFGAWNGPEAAEPLLLVRSPYALGWIPADAPLSAVAPEPARALLLQGPRTVLPIPAVIGGLEMPLATSLPIDPEGDTVQGGETFSRALVGRADGFDWHTIPPELTRPTPRPLTRRAFLEAAFSHLGEPYGWGGFEGGRDCSRFVLDVMARFGLSMPRHSAVQALAGSFTVEVEGMSSAEKLLVLEEAQARGVVLLHFPGHIMIYLGHDESGEPMAIHAFSEYLEPCDSTRNDSSGAAGESLDTVRRVDRVAVTDLRLGAGSARRSFLERITKIAVFGRPTGPALRGIATPRRPAALRVPVEGASCDDSTLAAVFRSPRRPNPAQPLRVIMTLEEDPGPVELVLRDPGGRELRPELHRLGGPPFSYWVELPSPIPGGWTAALGEGDRVVTCERFNVARHPAPRDERGPDAEGNWGAAWRPAWSWERDTENLYSAFVEQLFRDPEGEDVTWTRLQELIADPSRNLLYDHRSVGEDAELALVPDCADLPYFLRAYFAWKARLPFAWRQCRRGREGRAPECDADYHHVLEATEGRSDVEAFVDLIRRVARNVHSSSNRTRPRDEASDVYPIDLRREAIRPGAVYADPYGHVLVVARWVDQGRDEGGALFAADAQPDGTVGRRRFWRGAFLFEPDTTEAGAGFKWWRPVRYDRAAEPELTLVPNAELVSSRDQPSYSETQYEGTRDAFYERMDALIDPRPRPAAAVLAGLVDALEEAVARRVNSVNNGEEFMRGRGYRTIEMPEGASIFQTSGPWEDYSTPSRDLRLLVSIDAVLAVLDRVRREPARYGVEAGPDGAAEPAALAALRVELDRQLAARRFQYSASDGRSVTLTLHELIERAEGMEMAYNPNDCVELRWAAPEGSPERASCRRQAPGEQRARMQSYRGWFVRRQRPAR